MPCGRNRPRAILPIPVTVLEPRNSERLPPRTMPGADFAGAKPGLKALRGLNRRWVAGVTASVLILPLAGAGASLITARAAAGLSATVGAGGTIEVSDGAVDMVFDPSQEGGISQLYDLTSDPAKTANIGPPAGFTLFDLYVSPAHGWANIAAGSAGVLEVLRNTPSSVVVHAVGAFMYTDGTGPVANLQHETWTTVYPGGRVFIRRHVITGASSVNLYNFGGKSLDVSPASSWNGIFTGAATDTSYPAGTNATAGNGTESWLGFWQPSGVGVGVASWQAQDFGISSKDVRLLVGNASVRSHEAQRNEAAITLGAGLTYTSQFAGWLSPQVRIASMNTLTADYQAPV